MAIIVQLFTQQGAKEAWPLLKPGLSVALMFLAGSVPWLLIATFCSIWGQAYNYLTLTEDMTPVLGIGPTDSNWPEYLRDVKTKWQAWHKAAISAFKIGTLTFVVGTGLLIWTFIGWRTFGVFLGSVVVSLVFLARSRPRGRATERKANYHDLGPVKPSA
jgi:O-antigen/teichoic acid export membrane protein